MNPIRRPFRYYYNNGALYLIGTAVVIFILQRFYPRLTVYLALSPWAVSEGRVWQFFTYMFVHDPRNLSHIIFNMLGLFMFGVQVEKRMGTKEFILYYFVTGALSGAFSLLLYWFAGPWGTYLIGASGAIFAVELAYAAFFPDSVIYIWGILPLRAPVMVAGFTLLALVSSLTGFGTGVAHLTHLAGFGFGWLYFLVRFGMNPWNSWFRR